MLDLRMLDPWSTSEQEQIPDQGLRQSLPFSAKYQIGISMSSVQIRNLQANI